VKLRFTAEAELEAEALDAWWRENRPGAPLLFADELAAVCDAIRRRPLILRRYGEQDGVAVYRWLLVRCQQHVYYSVGLEDEEVLVLRIWGARRKRGPKFSRAR
jgi:plasmid stabilization system protein ParE